MGSIGTSDNRIVHRSPSIIKLQRSDAEEKNSSKFLIISQAVLLVAPLSFLAWGIFFTTWSPYTVVLCCGLISACLLFSIVCFKQVTKEPIEPEPSRARSFSSYGRDLTVKSAHKFLLENEKLSSELPKELSFHSHKYKNMSDEENLIGIKDISLLNKKSKKTLRFNDMEDRVVMDFQFEANDEGNSYTSHRAYYHPKDAQIPGEEESLLCDEFCSRLGSMGRIEEEYEEPNFQLEVIEEYDSSPGSPENCDQQSENLDPDMTLPPIPEQEDAELHKRSVEGGGLSEKHEVAPEKRLLRPLLIELLPMTSKDGVFRWVGDDWNISSRAALPTPELRNENDIPVLHLTIDETQREDDTTTCKTPRQKSVISLCSNPNTMPEAQDQHQSNFSGFLGEEAGETQPDINTTSSKTSKQGSGIPWYSIQNTSPEELSKSNISGFLEDAGETQRDDNTKSIKTAKQKSCASRRSSSNTTLRAQDQHQSNFSGFLGEEAGETQPDINTTTSKTSKQESGIPWYSSQNNSPEELSKSNISGFLEEAGETQYDDNTKSSKISKQKSCASRRSSSNTTLRAQDQRQSNFSGFLGEEAGETQHEENYKTNTTPKQNSSTSWRSSPNTTPKALEQPQSNFSGFLGEDAGETSKQKSEISWCSGPNTTPQTQEQSQSNFLVFLGEETGETSKQKSAISRQRSPNTTPNTQERSQTNFSGSLGKEAGGISKQKSGVSRQSSLNTTPNAQESSQSNFSGFLGEYTSETSKPMSVISGRNSPNTTPQTREQSQGNLSGSLGEEAGETSKPTSGISWGNSPNTTANAQERSQSNFSGSLGEEAGETTKSGISRQTSPNTTPNAQERSQSNFSGILGEDAGEAFIQKSSISWPSSPNTRLTIQEQSQSKFSDLLGEGDGETDHIDDTKTCKIPKQMSVISLCNINTTHEAQPQSNYAGFHDGEADEAEHELWNTQSILDFVMGKPKKKSPNCVLAGKADEENSCGKSKTDHPKTSSSDSKSKTHESSIHFPSSNSEICNLSTTKQEDLAFNEPSAFKFNQEKDPDPRRRHITFDLNPTNISFGEKTGLLATESSKEDSRNQQFVTSSLKIKRKNKHKVRKQENLHPSRKVSQGNLKPGADMYGQKAAPVEKEGFWAEEKDIELKPKIEQNDFSYASPHGVDLQKIIRFPYGNERLEVNLAVSQNAKFPKAVMTSYQKCGFPTLKPKCYENDLNLTSRGRGTLQGDPYAKCPAEDNRLHPNPGAPQKKDNIVDIHLKQTVNFINKEGIERAKPHNRTSPVKPSHKKLKVNHCTETTDVGGHGDHPKSKRSPQLSPRVEHFCTDSRCKYHGDEPRCSCEMSRCNLQSPRQSAYVSSHHKPKRLTHQTESTLVKKSSSSYENVIIEKIVKQKKRTTKKFK